MQMVLAAMGIDWKEGKEKIRLNQPIMFVKVLDVVCFRHTNQTY
jgi:hypothetical protein